MVVRVLFVDHVVVFPVNSRRVTFTHMGLWMGHSLLMVVVVLVP